jgi:hypothetical protein
MPHRQLPEPDLEAKERPAGGRALQRLRQAEAREGRRKELARLAPNDPPVEPVSCPSCSTRKMKQNAERQAARKKKATKSA